MNLEDLITKKIKDNHLPLNVQDVLHECYFIGDEYYTENIQEIFYIYLLELFEDVFQDSYDKIKVHTQIINNKISTYYRFAAPEDYNDWLNKRVDIYDELHKDDIRLLNYIELSMFDFITDIYTCQKYTIVRKFFNKKIEKKFAYKKQTKKKFVKELVKHFNNKHNFKPL